MFIPQEFCELNFIYPWDRFEICMEAYEFLPPNCMVLDFTLRFERENHQKDGF